MGRNRVRRVSVIDEVVAQIEDAIVGGEYAPGSRLPSEAALSEELDVSRPILREALARLRERGYLVTVNGRGTFVRDSMLDLATEGLLRQVRMHVGDQIGLDELYEVRRTIEVRTARLAAEHAVDADLERLEAHVATMGESLAADPETYSAADIAFHLGIAQASGNTLYPLLLAPIVDLIAKAILTSVRTSPERMQSGINDHRRILECLRAGDSDAAATEVTEHLKRSRAMHSASTVETRMTNDQGWPRAIRIF